MSEKNIIECKYGHHMADREKDFTKSGLKKPNFTQCRKCKAEEMRRYRTKHKIEYNNKVREYHRNYQKSYRELKNNNNKIEVA